MKISKETMIKFKINGKSLFAKKIKLEKTLFQTRKMYENKLPKKFTFVCSDGTEIESEDEENFNLRDIVEKDESNYILNLITKEENNLQKVDETNLCKNNYKEKNEKIDENKVKTDETYDNKECPNPIFLSNNNNSNKGSSDNDKISKPEKILEKSNKFISENHDIFDKGFIYKDENNENDENEINTEIEHYKYKRLNQNKKKSKIFNKNKQEFYPSPSLNKSLEIIPKNNDIFQKRKKIDLSKYKRIEKIGKLKIYLYPSCTFTKKEEISALSFMVVGETGCGKTTLLNSFINSLLGVEMEDNYRFKIILEDSGKSQAYSQTSEVTYYNIRSVGGYPPVKIIDTPGYGDTRGIERDKEITAQIKELFQNQINTLNAVCFVTKSSNNRLTHSQKYILSSILDLFGNDVKEIFLFMLTFCDGGKPNIVEPLKEKDCLCKQIIDLHKDNNWYYKFNNSAIFEDNRDDEFTQMFWKLGMKNFEDFKKKLMTLPKKSLQLSRTVLNQRKYLEEKVQILSEKLKIGLNKVEEIKGIIKIVLSLKGDLNDSKNFTKTIMQPTIVKVPKEPNYYATTCLTCTKTCHKHCCIKDDDNKKNCSSMNEDGYCQFCPNKCFWDCHKNRDYIIEDRMEPKTITLEDLKKRYNYSKGQLSVKKQLFLGAKEELINLNLECLNTEEDMIKSINLLHEIALNKSVFESAEQHIDLLIEIEYSEHKPGWQNRVRGLNVLKEEKKMLREVYQGKNKSLKKIKKFIENEINKYCNLEIDDLENNNDNDCIIF